MDSCSGEANLRLSHFSSSAHPPSNPSRLACCSLNPSQESPNTLTTPRGRNKNSPCGAGGGGGGGGSSGVCTGRSLRLTCADRECRRVSRAPTFNRLATPPDFPPHDQLGRSALLRDAVSGFLDLGRSDVAEKSHKQP